jgi:Mn2+/Fe2+ NRAMP family transporter
MGRFIAMLLIGPWLAVLSWLYWQYARRHTAQRISARFDAVILAVAWLAAVACALAAYQLALGHAGPIWKQVAAAWGAYPGFAVVLFFGLARHRQAGHHDRA